MNLSGCGIEIDKESIKQLEKTYKALDRTGKRPQKAVNKGVSKGAQVLKRKAKATVPVKTGTLKKNIVIATEKTKIRGKKVKEITFRGGEQANNELQKSIVQRGILGGKSPKAYYPASQEFGFLARAKGSGSLVYYDERTGGFRPRPGTEGQQPDTQEIEGKHFMKAAADAAASQSDRVTVDTIMKEIEKAWREDQ